MLRAYIRDFRIGGMAVLQERFCYGRVCGSLFPGKKGGNGTFPEEAGKGTAIPV